MIRRILILTLFFYLLALLQASFLVHFRIFGLVPNIIFIAVILINLFEKPKRYSGLYAGFIGGLFLDIFSSAFIGFYMLILIAVSLFLKIILRKYVWAPLS